MIKMTFCPFANLAQINHHLSGEGANKVFILHNKTPGHKNTRISTNQDNKTLCYHIKTPEYQNTATLKVQETKTLWHRNSGTHRH